MFMKKIILFLLAWPAFNFSIAQSILPEVISSTGQSFNNGSSQLDFTMGEVTTSTFNDGSTILSQGFHQPNLLITSIISTETNYTVAVFPNPTSEFLQLHFDKLNQILVIDLYSGEGKLLQSQKVSTTITLELNMSTYASGTYLLSVKDESSKVKTYQIIKTN